MAQATRISPYPQVVEPLKKAEDLSKKAFVLDVEQAIQTAFNEDVQSGMALLFASYYAILCSHALRLVQSKAIAEDIVSDILYEFHLHQRHHTITSSFRAFLFTAVRNRAFDCIKTEIKRSVLLADAPVQFTPPPQLPDAITQYEDLCADFQKAIDTMPSKQRQIYLKNRFEGKKNQEIADELAISTRTIEAHLYQANRQIRAFLQNKWLIIIPIIAFLWF